MNTATQEDNYLRSVDWILSHIDDVDIPEYVEIEV